MTGLNIEQTEECNQNDKCIKHFTTLSRGLLTWVRVSVLPKCAKYRQNVDKPK